ncbi:MAG TPA: choline/ethanolamine kinase family protein [Gaiellaceae bacterium]|nr:choline/ethanolamine kinase family protein [Gaiellaceae bacterium]
MSLQPVLETVPELRNAQHVEPLPGGLTNQNYKVVTPNGSYVIRISHKDSSLLAIDRENELHNTIAAAEAGVGAPFVAALPEHDALVIGFLEGRALTPDDLRERNELIPLVADACRRLHAARPFLESFDMFEIQRRYLGVVREREFQLPRRYLEFEPQLRAVEHALAARPEEKRPCNNDLLAENFIEGGGELKLIDYEYSGNNEPSFELGNIWSESNLSLAQLDELVACYWGAPLRSKVARARLWGLVAKYGWMLWASIQDGVSELDFDFWAWGLEKYDRAVAEFDSPDFERLLHEVRTDD